MNSPTGIQASLPQTASPLGPEDTADLLLKDYSLASTNGTSDARVQARIRTVRQFFEIHLPTKLHSDQDAYLATVDLAQPVRYVNGRHIDTAQTPSRGFLGLAKRHQYLLSGAYPPKSPDDPIYALESVPAKNRAKM